MSEPEPARQGEVQQGEATAASAIDRRAWVRYASNLPAAARSPGASREVGWGGQLVNISVGGIGLLLQHRFRRGTPLTVELKSPAGKVLLTADVRVAHATAVRDRVSCRWLIGCAFDQPLSEADLQRLLRADDAPPA
jgi:PilZ domain